MCRSKEICDISHDVWNARMPHIVDKGIPNIRRVSRTSKKCNEQHETKASFLLCRRSIGSIKTHIRRACQKIILNVQDNRREKLANQHQEISVVSERTWIRRILVSHKRMQTISIQNARNKRWKTIEKQEISQNVHADSQFHAKSDAMRSRDFGTINEFDKG